MVTDMHNASLPEHTCYVVRRAATAFALAVTGLLAGCTSSPPVRLDEWASAQNCHFAHVARGEFETALRRVFEASAPKVYGLRPEGGGALVEKHWTLDVIFASVSGAERWRLEYAPAGDGIDVHAEVEHTSAPGPLAKRMETQRSADRPNYELLWSRVAYVLGNRGDWPRCEKSKIPGAGLCSTGSSQPPPLRLAGSR